MQSTNELGKSRTYSYDPAGNLILASDELGRRTAYAYDVLNQTSSMTDALGGVTQYQRDAIGNLTQVTLANGSTWGYQYDPLSRLVGERNQLGKTQSFTYDPVGDLVIRLDFAGHQTAFSYDPLQRIVKADYFDGSKKTLSYDAVGNLVGATNPTGSLQFTYDADRRLTQSSDSASGQTLAYSYDSAGNRVSLSWQQQQQSIRYAWGKANELLSVTDGQGRRTSFTYDSLLRETSRVLPNGVASTRSYDAAGRLLAIKNATQDIRGGRDDDALRSEAYLYNDAGQRTYTVDNFGRISAYSYDADGWLTGVSYPISNDLVASALKERLAFGLIATDTTGKGKGNDGLAFLKGLGAGKSDDFDPKGLSDRLGELVGKFVDHGKLAVGPGATAFASRLSVDAPTAAALQQAYAGIASRGRWAGQLNTSPWEWTESYSYDSMGNRTSKANGWGAVSYSYDAANELLQAGSRQFGYDANGNLVSESLAGATATYAYTPENRIAQVSTDVRNPLLMASGGKDFQLKGNPGNFSGRFGVSYGYDALGRRAVRQQFSTITEAGNKGKEWDSTVNQRYVYDGTSLQMVAELTGMNADMHDQRFSQAFGVDDFSPAVEYVSGNGRLAARVELQRRGDVSYYTQDIMGSTMQLTDGRSEVQQSYSYEAFGVAYRGTFGGDNSFGYTGKRYDGRAALHDYGFRDYKPLTARWTTPDPIRAGLNWYAYVNNNPINFIDPWGLDAGLTTWQYDESRIDSSSLKQIATLAPDVAEAARSTVIEAKNEGINVVVTQGYRSNEDQAKAYAVGRDAAGNIVGPVITYAKPGESPHNLIPSQAFDVAVLNKNGFENWNYSSKEWKEVGQIGKSNDLTWGGDWTTPYDPPHFQSPSFGQTNPAPTGGSPLKGK